MPQQAAAPMTFTNIQPIDGGGTSAPAGAAPVTSANGFTNIQPLYPADSSASTDASAGADTSGSTAGATPTTPNDFGVGKSGGVVSDLVAGFEKGANKTAQGAINLLNKGNRALAGGAGGDIPSLPVVQAGEDLQAHGAAQNIGEGVENIAEFAAGDEALSGLAKATRIAELAQKYPAIARTLAMAKEHPVLAKIIGEATKGATVGGVQGGVKGAQEGDATGGAVSGAIGGGVGGAGGAIVGETAGGIAKLLGEKFGVGTSAVEDAVKGARPGKRNVRFKDDFLRAAPYVDKVNAADPAKSVEDWADHFDTARENLYKNQIDPLVRRHATVPLGGLNIADSIRSEIPSAMKIHAPEQAAKMEELANKFMPGQTFQLSVGDAEDALQHYNAQLAATGFWSKMPSERAALLKTNGEIAGLKATGDAIRDELYGKLGQLEPGSDIAKLKKDYGALRNIGDEVRGRVNVNNRQSPISLKETIGMITGLAHGGPGGLLMAGLPMADRFGNAPEKLISRAVQKAARPGEESIVSKAVQAGSRAVQSAAPKVGAQAGAGVGRLFFTASDGSMHSVPNTPDSINQVHAIDPNVTFHEAPQR
jgi:hypothetical protein